MSKVKREAKRKRNGARPGYTLLGQSMSDEAMRRTKENSPCNAHGAPLCNGAEDADAIVSLVFVDENANGGFHRSGGEFFGKIDEVIHGMRDGRCDGGGCSSEDDGSATQSVKSTTGMSLYGEGSR